MNRTFLIALCLWLMSPSISADSFPEPFGLKWGMTEDELKQNGFVAIEKYDGWFNGMSSKSTPKPWSKAETYLALTYNNRLVKVAAISVDITDDIYGLEGMVMYNEIKDRLAKKYGNPSTEQEFIGRDLYDDADEFYQCLKRSGCGAYLSLFKFSGGTIAIQLKGKRRGSGYLSIGYESPDFLIAKEQIRQESSKSDDEAF